MANDLGGVLTDGGVLDGLADRGASVSVQQTMRGELETASPSEAIDSALTRMHQGERLEGGREREGRLPPDHR
jgi:hypothetical protein